MIIHVNKFGKTLVSRPAGKEAWLAFQSTLNNVPAGEEVVVDFENVFVLTPSWADEFLTPLKERFSHQLKLINTNNPSVMATLAILL